MKYTYICFFLIICLLSGCSNWLDVNSKSDVDIDEMFETSEGYYSSLSGVYVNLGSENLYGSYMTIYGLEPLTQQYTIYNLTGNNDRQEWAEFKYSNATYEKVIANIWGTMYNNIVNTNIFIEQLAKANHPYFEDGVLDIMKAEALALRAYMYFDLVRMFNESYTVNPQSDKVPYKTDFGLLVGEKQTTNVLLNNCLRDLQTAQDLLKEYDPIVTGKTYQDKYVSFDRVRRMNYYATTALYARISLYIGNYEDALENAQIVIDSNNFRFIEEQEIIETDIYGMETKVDRIFMPEMIFALNSNIIQTTSQSILEGLSGDFVKSNNSYIAGDLRLTWLYTNPSANNRINLIRFQRSKSTDDTAVYPDPIMPMCKLSEMYLIASEATLKGGLGFNSISYLNALKQHRKTPELASSATDDEIMKEITHEYICDFRGEGQLFFYYKRLNMASVDDGKYTGNITEISPANYIFPLPQYEIDFGNK